MPTMSKLQEDLDFVLEAVASLNTTHNKDAGLHYEHLDKVFGMQIEEVSKLVRQLREDANTALSNHPASAIAAALTLGFTIGRLTSK